MGRRVVAIMISFAWSLVCGQACEKGLRGTERGDSPNLRVLGYVFTSDWRAVTSRIEWTKITDLNVAFINPDVSGNFFVPEGVAQLVNVAHQEGIRVFFSIGGGSPPAHLEQLLASSEGCTKLVDGIAGVLERYGFDGVDIDLENALINEHYAPFVASVAKSVRPMGKLVTAALARWNADQIADETLAHYDFINIMSYDATGPWNLDNPGPHSPYQMAVDDFMYFNQTRGVAASRLFIGLPFYGYGFGPGAPESIYYRDIVARWPEGASKDEISLPAGGKIYYNGMPTIRQKTQFALENGAGGVMIWHLLHDAENEWSLLHTIQETIYQPLK
ncbi:glycosyl hydrolase family 18 protein [Parapedobacter deserti]|uniref:chitinase n=1 Tax=Parapedobacter deserti TaxID=1912957 RepID=A0ABV7JPU3_9SPHI